MVYLHSTGEIFLAGVASERREIWETIPNLEACLVSHIDAGRCAWPGIELPTERFLRHLADKIVNDDTSRAPAAALHAVRAADLYLACACVEQDPRAIASFQANYFSDVDAALRHLGLATPMIEDVKARLLRLLFVKEGSNPPSIAGYSGRGALRSWLRSVAVRTAMKMLRAERQPEAGDEALEAMPSPARDPAIAYLKALYGEEFKTAFEQAIFGLSQRERNLLRQHFIDGLSLDQMGGLYRVHRATAARWLAAARASAFRRTRELLVERLRVSESDMESILRLVRSQWNVSIRRLLRESESGVQAAPGSNSKAHGATAIAEGVSRARGER